MKNKSILFILVNFIFLSCGIFKTHHKDKLIDFAKNEIPDNTLILNGYYYAELEREPENFDKIQGKPIKYLSVLFIYEDGFVLNIGEIDGLTNYYCTVNKIFENSYESAHRNVELLLESQNSEDKRTKRICGFKPNDINNKGLVEIDNGKVKIQYYRVEPQRPGKDSYNSAYLYERNGIIKSDSCFIIENEMNLRKNKITIKNTEFRFRQTEEKPNIYNYFKKN